MRKENINLAIEAAAKSKSDEAYQLFFNLIKGHELFFNLSDSSNDDDIRVPIVSVGDDLTAVVFYTSSNDKRLGTPYAGIAWEKGLEMVSKMRDADGLVIQGTSDSWIAIKKDKIVELLNQEV
jgi:hypothetical protein